SMLVSGLGLLIEIILEALAERTVGAGAVVWSGSLIGRVSFAASTGGIGLVAWAIHWGLATRAAHGADGTAERRSGIRKLYLYAALFVGGLWAMFSLADVVRQLLRALFEPTTVAELASDRTLEPLAAILAIVPFWLYHARVASHDRAAVSEVGAGATLRRWCVYGLAFV